MVGRRCGELSAVAVDSAVGGRRHGRRRRGLGARRGRLRGPYRSHQLGPEQPGDDAEPECQHEQEQREGDPVGVAVGRCLGRRLDRRGGRWWRERGHVVPRVWWCVSASVLRGRALVGSGL